MKVLTVIFLTLIFSLTASGQSDELNRQLAELKRQGLVVRMGELTGAGGKMSLSRVHSFIHPDGLIQKSACSAIKVRANSALTDPKVADIVQIKIGRDEVTAAEIVGIVTTE